MTYLMNFGGHKGESLEWLFFHDPSYVTWILEKNIHENTARFPGAAKGRFEKLVKRASHLKIPGLCKWCESRPITRMFYTVNRNRKVTKIDFDCGVCEPDGSSLSIPFAPSFFPPDCGIRFDKTASKLLIRSLREAYFESTSVKLTQRRLEEFFDDPGNFVDF
jgi:hypothetical protein